MEYLWTQGNFLLRVKLEGSDFRDNSSQESVK